MFSRITHQELVTFSVKWLRDEMKCPIVVSEFSPYAGENPDVIGFYDGGDSVLIECKVSRTDLSGDKKKPFRASPEDGMGNLRYYAIPEEIYLGNENIIDGWGLIVFDDGNFRTVIEPKNFEHPKKEAEISFLVGTIRSSENKISIRRGGLSFLGKYRKYPKYKREVFDAELEFYIMDKECENRKSLIPKERDDYGRNIIDRALIRMEEQDFIENYNRDYPQPDGKFRSVSVYF